jgi:hypothetical protein
MARDESYEDERQWQRLQRLMSRRDSPWEVTAFWWLIGALAIIDLLSRIH